MRWWRRPGRRRSTKDAQVADLESCILDVTLRICRGAATVHPLRGAWRATPKRGDEDHASAKCGVHPLDRIRWHCGRWPVWHAGRAVHVPNDVRTAVLRDRDPHVPGSVDRGRHIKGDAAVNIRRATAVPAVPIADAPALRASPLVARSITDLARVSVQRRGNRFGIPLHQINLGAPFRTRRVDVAVAGSGGIRLRSFNEVDSRNAAALHTGYVDGEAKRLRKQPQPIKLCILPISGSSQDEVSPLIAPQRDARAVASTVRIPWARAIVLKQHTSTIQWRARPKWNKVSRSRTCVMALRQRRRRNTRPWWRRRRRWRHNGRYWRPTCPPRVHRGAVPRCLGRAASEQSTPWVAMWCRLYHYCTVRARCARPPAELELMPARYRNFDVSTPTYGSAYCTRTNLVTRI